MPEPGPGYNPLVWLLKDSRGQLLPFVAVALLIMMGFAALGMGLSRVYLDRTRVRDAVDAAATAALSPAVKKVRPTYHLWYEVCTKDGCYCRYRRFNYKPYIDLSSSNAEGAARAYFEKNLSADNIAGYKVLSWNVDINFDPHTEQVTYDNECDGYSYTKNEPFPRRVTAEVNVKVEVPVPLGNIGGWKTMQVPVRAVARKALQDWRPGE
ncbi:MAG: hypothetical protein PWQ18_673 [Clostridia bacterium]|nr:hypothetical protein [Clostridia bacterium]